MTKRNFGWLCGALMLALPSVTWAASIINLDTVAHRVMWGISEHAMQEMVLQPNQRWQRLEVDLHVRILDGTQPEHVYRLQDNDVWAIWSKGEFGIQMHQRASSNVR
jgi:hypothetical protein